jgi:hypothetical protein
MPQANTQTETRDMPTLFREAQLVPATYNEADNTVEVIWTAGARRRAYDWYSDTVYEEELLVSSEAVDMSRFEAGVVQVLDGHRVYGGVAAILGVAQRGWIDGGQGRAVLRLSQREELAGIVADIRAGIIRAISFGYSVQRYEITRAQDRTDGVNLPLYRATLWTPQEISFVTVPADPAAQTRAEHGSSTPQGGPPRGGRPCTFVRAAAPLPPPTSEHNMPQENTQHGGTSQNDASRQEAGAPPAGDAAQQAAAAAEAERQRSADITALCQRHGVANLAADLIRSGQTMDQACRAVLDERARLDEAGGGHRNVRVETMGDEHSTRMAGIEEAMLHRVDSRTQLTDNGRQYRSLTLLELGRELLTARGINTRGMNKLQVATEMLFGRSAGMQGTTDFTLITSNIANRRMRSAYDELPGTYRTWARQAPDAPDFKNMTVVQMSAAPELMRTNEHGEFTYGTVKDAGETYGLLSYGRLIGFTRQAIINDDMRAFDRIVTAFGYSAQRLENRLVYAQLTGTANMADGAPLFHADKHKNLGTGAATALSLDALSNGRKAMRKQVGLAGEKLNLAPCCLIIPTDLETLAFQLTSANYVPAKHGDINEFRSGGRAQLEPVCEALLDDLSATAWFLVASSTAVDTVEYCFLDGATGPVIESQVKFESEGIAIRCRHDFAAKAIDHRGFYKATGVA